MTVTLDLYQTAAVAVFVYAMGSFVKRIPFFNKYCIPASVIGGILFAVLTLTLNLTGTISVVTDTTLQNIFMTLFFTSVGYTASFNLLKKGGIQVFLFLLVATALIVLQNVAGVTLASLLGLDPLMGLCVGSVPLVGGHGTSGAFGPMLEQILLLLGVPIFLGLVFSHYFPNATKKITKPAQILSILLFIGMVTVSFSQNFQIFIDNIFYVFFIVMLHNASALMSGYFTGRLGKLPERDVRSLTVETGIQNSGLGLILLFNNAIFPAEIWHGHYGGMLFITAWWGIWHIISGLSVAYYFRRKPLQA